MVAALLLLLAFALLPLILVRDGRRERRRRGDYFAAVLDLFGSYRVTQESGAWPVVTARYRGTDVRLEAVPDDLAWRKLPSLWLKATVLMPASDRGTLGFLVRARGTEFYSPTAEMKHRLPIPAGFPSDALLCTDAPQSAPSLKLLESQMVAFEDPRMKELVITPKGVRLVYQAAQAERAHYLVLRQARFAEDKVDAALVRALLDRALAVAVLLDGAGQHTQLQGAA